MAEHQAFQYQPIDESPAWSLIKQPQQRRPYAQQPSLMRSVGFAWEGITYAFCTQRNFRIHCFAGAAAVLFAFFLRLPVHQTALVAALALLVLCAELINTAIEATLDFHVGSSFDISVKRIKDMAAAAVLVVCMGAVAVGTIVFLPALKAQGIL